MTIIEELTLSISDAASATGIGPHTLRYYEREGLMLDHVERSPSSNHRLYSGDDLRWILLLGRLRSTGMPVRTVRRYAELVRAGEGNERERLAILEGHRDDVLARLTEIERSLEAVDGKIATYRERLDTT